MTNTDQLREAILQAAAFNTKHISPYEPGMKNLIINVDMLVEQMKEVVEQHTANAVRAARIDELNRMPNHTEINLYVRDRLDALNKEGSNE